MGSKGGGETNTVSEFKPPEYTRPKWEEYLNRAYEVSNNYATNPGLIYGNAGQQLVSPLVQEQVDAIGGLRGMAMPFFGNSARLQEQGTNEHNAYMQALGGGMRQGPSEANAFMGVNNPYVDQMIAKNAGDMGDAFARGTGAQQTMAASRARALGGPAEAELQQVNNQQLNDAVGNMASGVRNQAYQQSAALDEARIGRNWNADEAGLNRQFGAVQQMPGRQQSNVGLMQALLGGGEMSRSLDQQNIEAMKNLHYQNVQLPMIALDIFGNALTRSSGGAGSSTQQMFGGYSPWATAGGIAGMLGGMMGG